MSLKNANQSRPSFSWKGLAAYAVPAIAFSFPLIPFAVYLPSYYAVDLALGFLPVAIVLFAARTIDILSDPIAGYLSDNISILKSRRRSWIILGGLVAGFALYKLAHPGAAPSTFALFMWSAILYIGWTFATVPYLAWGAELGSRFEDRTRVAAWREGFSLIGITLAVTLPFLIQGEISRLSLISFVVLPLGFIGLFALLAVPEIPPAHGRRRTHSPQDFKSLFKNKLFTHLLKIWFATSIANGIPAVLFPVYVSQWLGGDRNLENTIILIYFGAAVVAIPLWLFLSRFIITHKLMASSVLVACAAFAVVPFLPQGAVTSFVIITIISGIALAGELVLAPSLMADAIDYDRYLQKSDRAAMFFSIWGMASKLALGVAILIAFGLLGLAERIPDIGPQAAVPYIYALIPVALKLPAVCLLFSFPYPARRRDLTRRFLRKENNTN